MLNFADILAEYYKPEEEARLEELQEELNKLDTKTRREHKEEFEDFFVAYKKGQTILVEKWKEDYFRARDQIHSEAKAINEATLNRYKEEKKTEGILEDMRRIADSYEKEDFQAHIKHVQTLLEAERFHIHIKGEKEGKPYKVWLAENSEENYRNCFGWLYGNNTEIEELLDGEALYTAIEIIKARIDTFGYERPTEVVLSYREGEKTSEPVKPTLPKYDFVYPTDFQQNLTKASSTLFSSKNSLENLRQIAIDVSPNKKGLTTTHNVNVDLTAPELKGTENVTEYDKSVHNMAVSIGKVNEHGFFTAKQVATALLYGDNPSNSNPSKQQIGAVTKSIEKLALIRVTIDWTEHIRLNNKGDIPEGASFKVTDYMLPVRKYTATIGGQKVEGYQFIDRDNYTPLHQYATSVGQIGQHPVKMLNIPINLDQQKIVIRDFLLEEIAHIKNRTNWNNTISVDRLLEVAGESSQTIDRTKKRRLLKAVKDMLDYWKKKGYIKGYKEKKANTTGKPIQSFTILT
jgi:hypothetical protein